MDDEMKELSDLFAEEEGRLANEAADASLKALAMLGAYRGEATPLYRAEVAGLLVCTMMALASVRMCVEARRVYKIPGFQWFFWGRKGVVMDDEMKELSDLFAEEEGRLANEAADASLKALAMLGAYRGEATPLYRAEVAGLLVCTMMALASVRMCVEAVTGEMRDAQRLMYLCRLISSAFDVDPDQVIAELLAHARAGMDIN